MTAHLDDALALGSILVALSASGSASTLYVNRAISTGNNDGSIGANAYRDLDAVAVAFAAALPRTLEESGFAW